MLLITKLLAKILAVLNSEISPKQIAAGFAYGVIVGMLPVKGLMPYVLMLLSFIININLVGVAAAAAIFKIISFALDPLSNRLGYAVLTQPGLREFFTSLYNTPIIPYTRFNNTIVMGSLVLGLLLAIPMYFAAKYFVVHYRTRYRDRILKWKIVQIFKASAVWRWYETYRSVRG
jgi:uncharacterized protein (TIGR03546 family)